MTWTHKASQQWYSRPDDERFLSLDEMSAHLAYQRDHSRAVVVPSRQVTVIPVDVPGDADSSPSGRSVAVTSGNGKQGVPFLPTHWGFSQLAQLANVVSPTDLRKMHHAPELVADCVNYGLKVYRDVEDVGLLLYTDGHSEMRAATGPNYGRVWSCDVVDALVQRFGDGVTGEWKVPGEFGRDVPITRQNTTLYAGDRDMFVFLADEKNRVEVPNRRNGQPGSLARGFFVWNSEVGKSTLGLGTFLFDYACMNRIVWGGTMYQEIRVRHTASAPLRWIDEVQPVLKAYAESSADPIRAAIVAAQQKKIDDVEEFLATRFGSKKVQLLLKTHEIEEGRPIESLWDAATAVTAYARGVGHVDARVDLERKAGEIVALAA